MLKRFAISPEGIVEATNSVRGYLSACRIKGRELTRAVLVVEEALGSLVANAGERGEDAYIEIKTRKMLGNITIELSAPGTEYALEDNMASAAVVMNDEVGHDEQDQIRNIILRSLTDDLKYVHKNGINSIRMTIIKSKQSLFYLTIAALIMAIGAGLLLAQFASGEFNTGLDHYFLTPVKTMFMNALKMIVAPVVFFSIATAIGRFTNLSELGKIGGRVVGLYAVTTVLAIGVGFAMFFIFQPGGSATGIVMNEDASMITTQAQNSTSLIEMVVGIIPSDVLSPFINNNMLQLIFLAILVGAATGLIGKYSEVLRSIMDALNELFLKITNLIIKLMPIVVFCSVLSLILTIGTDTLWAVAGIFGTFIAGLFGMMLIYALMMIILARLNPLIFIKKYAVTMLQVFTLSSSNASIPINMEVCEKRLGISSKVYGLSIPLGATINMDGGCVQMGIFILALAKIYGVNIPAGALVTLAFSIFVMSVGTPGIPCASLICLAALLAQMNIPADAIVLVMGIAPVVSMFLTMSNCLGDVAVTSIVAKKTGEMNMKVYNDRNA
jgi:Na+/H+-dicarboxylate symporter